MLLIAMAELEREIIEGRVNSGLAAAREKGVKLGRPGTLANKHDDVLKLKRRDLGVRAIARELNIPVSSVGKVLSLSA